MDGVRTGLSDFSFPDNRISITAINNQQRWPHKEKKGKMLCRQHHNANKWHENVAANVNTVVNDRLRSNSTHRNNKRRKPWMQHLKYCYHRLCHLVALNQQMERTRSLRMNEAWTPVNFCLFSAGLKSSNLPSLLPISLIARMAKFSWCVLRSQMTCSLRFCCFSVFLFVKTTRISNKLPTTICRQRDRMQSTPPNAFDRSE